MSYPSEDQLKRIRNWDANDLDGLMEYLRNEVWHWGEWGIEKTESGRWLVNTGGWSGNEQIISAMVQNAVWWTLHWRETRRGGHFMFGSEQRHMKNRDGREIPRFSNHIRSSRVQDYLDALAQTGDEVQRRNAHEMQAEMGMWASRAEEIEDWIEREIGKSQRLEEMAQELQSQNESLTDVLTALESAIRKLRGAGAPCDICYEERCVGVPSDHCPCNQRCHNRKEDAETKVEAALDEAKEALNASQTIA